MCNARDDPGPCWPPPGAGYAGYGLRESLAPPHGEMTRWQWVGSCKIFIVLSCSRFLVLVLLANCIQNMLASCPLVCDIENVLKVSTQCDPLVWEYSALRHHTALNQILHSLTAKLAILRAQQTVMCSALSLPISQTTNYIIWLYNVVSDLCLHLEKWEGDSWMYQQRPGRDTRGCWALDPGDVSDNLFKSLSLAFKC